MKCYQFLLLVTALIVAFVPNVFSSEINKLSSLGDPGDKREVNTVKRHLKESNLNENEERAEWFQALRRFLSKLIFSKNEKEQVQKVLAELKKSPDKTTKDAYDKLGVNKVSLANNNNVLERKKVVNFFSSHEFQAWLDFIKSKNPNAENAYVPVVKALDEIFERETVNAMYHYALSSRKTKKLGEHLRLARTELDNPWMANPQLWRFKKRAKPAAPAAPGAPGEIVPIVH